MINKFRYKKPLQQTDVLDSKNTLKIKNEQELCNVDDEEKRRDVETMDKSKVSEFCVLFIV